MHILQVVVSVIAVVVASSPLLALDRVPELENSWLGNTFGGGEELVQNYIADMTVDADGTIHTRSGWDEAGNPNGMYKDGHMLGNEPDSPADSRRCSGDGVTWTIENFYGRGFADNPGPVPSGPAAPYVRGSNGKVIRDVVDPSAIAIDNRGRLMIADNGPDQNIKIYDVSGDPRLVETFGERGGVYAGPTPGMVGDKRFWGMRGIGCDENGVKYVACCGYMSQCGGGTDLRAFNTDGTLKWQLLGICFVNTADFDPACDGTMLYLNTERVEMDYRKPTDQQWRYQAITIDPFKYPDDPRLMLSLESVWIRRINGHRFMFLTDMYSQFLAVYRFDGEIAVPAAFFCVAWNGQWDKYKWQIDKRPTWDADREPTRRWLWRDTNGDGAVQSNEFTTYDVGYPYLKGIDVDKYGTVRISSRKLLTFRCSGIDANGVPLYSVDDSTIENSPYGEGGGDMTRLLYVADEDVMFFATAGSFPNFGTIIRFDNWSGTRNRRWTLDLHPSAQLTPIAFTADKDFVFVTYVHNGPDANTQGEVTVFDAETAAKVAYINPGPETNHESGWVDLGYAMNVFTRNSGEKILTVEEDWKAKVMAYRWCPEGNCAQVDGDVNGDCKVNIIDLIAVRNHLQEVSSSDNAHADVNRDGKINILDLIYIRNRLNDRCTDN